MRRRKAPKPRTKHLVRRKALRTVSPKKSRRRVLYEKHLRSAHWKALRLACFARDGHQCRRCKDVLPVAVLTCDHLHYRTFGHETLADVQTLCVPCHRQKDKRGMLRAIAQR